MPLLDHLNLASDLKTSKSLNGDGKTDLIWRNYGTGENVAWLMDGASITSGSNLPLVPTDWDFAQTELNGDGKTDLIWRNYGTGENVAWLMDGASITSGSNLPPVPPSDWDLTIA